jgi:hypothetical protein
VGNAGPRRLLEVRRAEISEFVPSSEIFPPATMGHIRGHGCRNLFVYCASGLCNHSARISDDWLAADVPVRSLCGRMVCTKCGMIGADVRPDWSPHR